LDSNDDDVVDDDDDDQHPFEPERPVKAFLPTFQRTFDYSRSPYYYTKTYFVPYQGWH
jgi:hypothetical protein